MKLVRYHEAAATELLNAVGYLELQKSALGKRFLVILAVAHASRRPGYWVDRVSSEDT